MSIRATGCRRLDSLVEFVGFVIRREAVLFEVLQLSLWKVKNIDETKIKERNTCTIGHFWCCLLPRVKTSLDVRTHMKMCLGLHVRFRANQSHFHMKGFARWLVLKQRCKVTQKWPNIFMEFFTISNRYRVAWPIGKKIIRDSTLIDNDLARCTWNWIKLLIVGFFFFFFRVSTKTTEMRGCCMLQHRKR